MLRIYICPKCASTRIISNNRDNSCPYCNINMCRADITYEVFVNMDIDARTKFVNNWIKKYEQQEKRDK